MIFSDYIESLTFMDASAPVMIKLGTSAVVVEWSSTELPGCRPEFAPQAALIAIRLTNLVAPPNGYSIARLY